MPHIVIEHTPNLSHLPFAEMLACVTSSLAGSEEVGDEADLKARVYCPEAYRVGTADSGRGFIHVTLRILSGRTPQAKRDLCTRVVEGMRQRMPQMPDGLTVHLSVEVVDMDRDSYGKVRLG